MMLLLIAVASFTRWLFWGGPGCKPGPGNICQRFAGPPAGISGKEIRRAGSVDHLPDNLPQFLR